jgi:hypothetical protein
VFGKEFDGPVQYQFRQFYSETMAGIRQEEMNVIATVAANGFHRRAAGLSCLQLMNSCFASSAGSLLSNSPAGLADGLELESTLSEKRTSPRNYWVPRFSREECHNEFGHLRLAWQHGAARDAAAANKVAAVLSQNEAPERGYLPGAYGNYLALKGNNTKKYFRL